MQDIYITRAMEAIPRDVPSVVPGTTPVVSFGSPTKARVATLSINPSHREFLDAKNKLLTGAHTRLLDRSTLATDHETLSEDAARRVVQSCFDYFANPKTVYSWFSPMEKLVLPVFEASYFDGSACALDLVQWATQPIWRSVPDAERERLLEADTAFLESVLERESFDYVLMNGKQVIEHLNSSGLATTTVCGTGSYPTGKGAQSFDVHVGMTANGTKLVGWTFYLQNMFAPATVRADAVSQARAIADAGLTRLSS